MSPPLIKVYFLLSKYQTKRKEIAYLVPVARKPFVHVSHSHLQSFFMPQNWQYLKAVCFQVVSLSIYPTDTTTIHQEWKISITFDTNVYLDWKTNSPKSTLNTFCCPYLKNSPASHGKCLKSEEWWQFTCPRGRRSLSLWHMFCKKKKRKDKNLSIQCHPGSEGETMTIIHIWSILKCDTNLWYPAVKIICPSSLKLSAFMF